MTRESFLIYKEHYPAIEFLSDEQLGKLFRALFLYQREGVETDDMEIKMAFLFFKNQFRVDEAKYQRRVEANRRNGQKGGRPIDNEEDTENPNEPKEPNGLNGLPNNPLGPDNDNGNDNDNDNENDNRKKRIRFVPPRKEEVILYFLENGYKESAAVKAFTYYDVAAWKDSNGRRVKNWKQKMLSVWFKDENRSEFSPPEQPLKKQKCVFVREGDNRVEMEDGSFVFVGAEGIKRWKEANKDKSIFDVV